MARSPVNLPSCSDCGKVLSKPGYQRCRKCSVPLREAARVATREAHGLAHIVANLPADTQRERWTIIGTPKLRPARPGGKRRWFVRARCQCGTEADVLCQNLLNGNTDSCGCFKDEMTAARKTTHGGSRTKLYSVWKGMVS